MRDRELAGRRRRRFRATTDSQHSFPVASNVLARQFAQPTDFLERYHKRSNVETTFSMIKRKFGDSLRSKSDVAMTNEVLAKVLCHNLAVLIHEM